MQIEENKKKTRGYPGRYQKMAVTIVEKTVMKIVEKMKEESEKGKRPRLV